MKVTDTARLGVLAAAIACGSANAVVLINENFESFDPQVANFDYTVVNAGTLGAWTVGGTSIDLIQNNYGAINNVSVDLSGSPGPGSLSQSFNAIAGWTYTLTWDYFKNGDGTPLDVTLGTLSHSFAAPAVITAGLLVWTATTNAPFTVSFAGGPGVQGPTLDNVSLTAAIPEPETNALMLAGLGVIGFVASRRRPNQG